MTQDRSITTCTITWQEITIEVSYEADWLGMHALNPEWGHAHLQLQSLEPERAELPVTETGYRSHFPARGTVEAAGGPAAFALSWLDTEARNPAWREREAASRQLSLF